MTLRTPGPTRWLRVRTRVLDRAIAIVLAPIVGPVVAILASRVRREDGPPGVIGLPRCGRGGGSFPMWKLRSMRVREPDASAGGPVITAGADDERITEVGAMLRRWRIDELPQLWNVIRGDMSLIGARPETPSLVDLDDDRWRTVLSVPPGVTGATQLLVEAWEGEALVGGGALDRYATDILPVKLAVDRWYVEHASPAIDLRIAWSMVERFALGRRHTSIERLARVQVPEARSVPLPADVRG